MLSIEAKQMIEIEFWRDSNDESPAADSLYNIINKVSDAEVFLGCLNRHQDKLSPNGRVLELGRGQGWASCVYKKLFPDSHVTATDISEFAVMSLPKWERLFDVRIDNSYACPSYAINELDASLDQIFCFAAAHHFLAHRRTLREISRVLKRGGKTFYFNEPAAPRYLYAPACWRVNRKRPEVPEDVLVTSTLRELAHENGLDMQLDYYPSLIRRGAFETIYFFVLGRIPFLQRLLPCSVNIIFTKRGVQGRRTGPTSGGSVATPAMRSLSTFGQSDMRGFESLEKTNLLPACPTDRSDEHIQPIGPSQLAPIPSRSA